MGLGGWLIAGSTSVPRVVAAPRASLAWLAAYSAYGLLFWLGTGRGAARERTIACLVGQAVCAATLAYLGMPAFEGALLALVAAQLPLALPLWGAAAWALAQVVVLWVALPHDYNRVEIAKSLSAYLGFATLALAMVRLFDAERRARVDLARADERVRIARELHDVLGHHLAALSIQLDVARRSARVRTLERSESTDPHGDAGDDRSPLDEAYGIARRMLGDVRETVSALRKDRYDLRGALDTVVKEVAEPPIAVSFPAEVEVSDAACAHVALRCIQEAITNTVKHARAKKIDVALSREGDELMITIRDDGAAAGDIRIGHGLRGMRERIEELGGELDVESVAGRGTTVRARLPTRPS